MAKQCTKYQMNICKQWEKKVQKTDTLCHFLSPRAITQWNKDRSKPNSNLICNLVWQSNVPNIKWISASSEKKSAENWFTGLTDRQTDGQTDGRTECKPKVPFDFVGRGLKKSLYCLLFIKLSIVLLCYKNYV